MKKIVLLFAIGLFCSYASTAQNPNYQNNLPPLNPTKYVKLPLGVVKPKGWLFDELTVQANGLTGHLQDVWDIVHTSGWKGDIGQNVLPECCFPRFVPRWLEGLVPLAYELNDKRLIDLSNQYMSFLMTVEDCGKVTPSGVAWSHLGRVLQGYYEATGDKRAIKLCKKIIEYSNNIKDVNSRAITTPERLGMVLGFGWWGYNKTGDQAIISMVNNISQKNVEDWRDYFTNFAERDVTAKSGYPVAKDDMGRHGVDVAQALQYPISYALGGKDNLYIKSVFQGIDNLDKFDGQVAGRFTADEYLAGLKPTQGTELCTITESIYSLEKDFEAIGDVSMADRMEKLVFNALPGGCTGDMWSHQYDQQANQVMVSDNSTRLWHKNDATANVFGFTPHYSCCLSNMHSPFPRFIENMWMATNDNGLIASSYGPSEAKAKVAENTDITINEVTDYPFKDDIVLQVTLSKSSSFPLYFRIPGWSNKASINVGGKTIFPESGSVCKIERVWKTGDVISLKFNPQLRTANGYNNAASVSWGPLSFVLKIGESFKKIDIKMDKPIKPAFATGVANWQISPTTAWNYALLIDKEKPAYEIQFNPLGKLPFARKGEPVFLAGASDFTNWTEEPPIVIRVKAKQVNNWQMDGGNSGDVPLRPSVGNNKQTTIELIPYGCTRLRISEFPVISPGKRQGG